MSAVLTERPCDPPREAERKLRAAATLLEEANAELEPAALTSVEARGLLGMYTKVQRLGAFGVATLAQTAENATDLSRAAGTSVGEAKATMETGRVLQEAPELREALQHGEVSLPQAAEIAKAEAAAPGASLELLTVAKEQSFQVLKEQARKVKLEAEQHRGLAERQHEARSARSHTDDLGMVNVHLRLEPHVGTPIVARADAEAERRARAAKRAGEEDGQEPFEHHLADAYAALLSGKGKGRARRPELVVLVSREVAKRGWEDVRKGELCKIPGVGPVAPPVAKEIAKDAFLSGVFYDGTDLRHFKRWSRHIPVEVQVALELGEAPEFEGVACTDCGRRFRPEFDHLVPCAAQGETSLPNLNPRCWSCHRAKGDRDRRAGKLERAGPSTA
ncbi:MAG: HNH endonuclease signature motif containing protein [Actinomycetota bacterium]